MLYCEVYDMFEIVFNLLYFLLDVPYVLICPFGVVFGYSLNLYLCQLDNIIIGNFTSEAGLEWLDGPVNGLDNFFPSLAVLYLQVYAVFDKDFFQRSKMPCLLQFMQFNFELFAKYVHCIIHRTP